MLTSEEFFSSVEEFSGKKLNEEQKRAVETTDESLWIVAGPGSGKTEVLALRVLYLLLVKGVPPKSIFVTTFTRKAAINLQDRILLYFSQFNRKYPGKFNFIEPLDLWLGTLHSLSKKVLEEFRYSRFENFKVLSDLEQDFFILNHSSGVRNGKKFLSLWKYFRKLFKFEGGAPDFLVRVDVLKKLFNGIVEFRVNTENLENSKEEALKQLAVLYSEYREKLNSYGFVDFPHLQELFLEFLSSAESEQFLNGDTEATELYPGIRYVMVDEYQDTNPIQEEIYFKLSRKSGNICVVGDDDQALFRFRGASVICFVNFDKACCHYVGKEPERVFLLKNYRSDESIVEFANRYLDSYSDFLSGQRVDDKPSIESVHGRLISCGDAVKFIRGKGIEELTKLFADFISKLVSLGVDPSNCALLLPSSRKFYVEPFERVLKEKGIEIYNPRAKALLHYNEVKVLFGTILEIVDPEERIPGFLSRDEYFMNWLGNSRASCYRLKEKYREIEQFVECARAAIKSGRDLKLMELFYRILALPYFRELKEHPEKALIFVKISEILEAFAFTPTVDGERRDFIQNSDRWRNAFYLMLALMEKRGLDELEEENVVVPKGKFPIMTIHQSKGLEFSVVFVFRVVDKFFPDSSIWLEREFLRFSSLPYREQIIGAYELSSEIEKKKTIGDRSKKFYVAYTRAKHLLCLLFTEGDLKYYRNSENFIGFPGMNPGGDSHGFN